MPLEIIETTDPIAELVTFDQSPVYEMMVSLVLFLEPKRQHREWVEAGRQVLSPEFFTEMQEILVPFKKGLLFFELAVDYPNHRDVTGFIDFVRNMSEATFLFYVLGRVVPLKFIEALDALTIENMQAALAASDERFAHFCDELPMEDLLKAMPGFQNRLADLWQYYWDTWFGSQVGNLEDAWANAIGDRQRYLNREGGEALMSAIMTKFHHLPHPLPEDMPYTEIKLVPVSLLHSRAYMFFGYGNITVLFNANLTEERAKEIEQAKDDALNVLRALSDNTRLSILQLVVRWHGKVHGKKIAEVLDISPSVVSRHLSQLRDSGLLEEMPQENRIIYYTLKEDAITSLPEKLLDYLFN